MGSLPSITVHNLQGAAQFRLPSCQGLTSARKAVKLPDPGTKGGLELRRECGIASHLAYLGWALVKGPPTACRLVPGQQGPSPLPAGN